jgi:hypothetical protein
LGDIEGLSFNANGVLYGVDDITDQLVTWSVTTGPQGEEVTGLAASGNTIYGLGGDGTNNLVTMKPATGRRPRSSRWAR